MLQEKVINAIRIVSVIVGTEYRRAKDIAEMLDVDLSVSYIESLLQQLSKQGIVIAVKGRNGGYKRAKPEISTMDLYLAMYGEMGLRGDTDIKAFNEVVTGIEKVMKKVKV